MTKIEQEFFKTFGIKPNGYKCEDYSCICCDEYETCIKGKFPQITDRVLLKLENIFAHNEMDKSGFFDGFQLRKYFNPYAASKNKIRWEYQITYRKGGYYTRGIGKTRKEALLNQFIEIMNDKEVDKEEKEIIYNQVQSLFREVEE